MTAIPGKVAALCADCDAIYDGSRSRSCPACGGTSSTGLMARLDKPPGIAFDSARVCLHCWIVSSAPICPRCGKWESAPLSELVTARQRVVALAGRRRRAS